MERQPGFEKFVNQPPRGNRLRTLYGFGKKIARIGTIAAGLVAAEQAQPVLAQEKNPIVFTSHAHTIEESKNKAPANYSFKFDASADIIMRNTEVKPWGYGLRVYRSKKYIELYKNGDVDNVIITAEGPAELLVKIHEKHGSEGGEGKTTEIKISHGYIEPGTGQESFVHDIKQEDVGKAR